MFLTRILEAKKSEVEQLKAAESEFPLRTRPRYSLMERLQKFDSMAVISEIKRGSPSRGHFAPDLNVVETARVYEASGASAVSVLTDSHFFGSYEDLKTVADSIHIPVLAKDFMIDPVQLRQANACGADLILLIVAALSRNELTDLMVEAHKLGLEVLVEIHDEDDLEKIQGLEIPLLGINHRNLKTFETSLDVSATLIKQLPPSKQFRIAESGIHTVEDVKILSARGFNGILVGESLIRSGETGGLLNQMASVKTSVR